MPPVSVISLLVWDSPRYLRNLLDNLDAYTPGHRYHLRILDQGSGPETVEMLRGWSAGKNHVSVDFLTHNIGYSAGHNRNYESLQRLVDFQYFVTINNDLAFGAPGWLNTLTEAMEAAPSAAVGGPVCYKSYPNHIAPATRAQKAAGDFLFVSGAVSIIRAETVRRCGLFDEVFTPAYWEDTDMCLRYRRFGYTHLWTDIDIVHGYLGEAGRVNQTKYAELDALYGDFRTRNQLTFMDRWKADRITAYPARPDDLPAAFPRLYFPPGPVVTDGRVPVEMAAS